jgi:large subunit ribosomal protein L13e
VIVFPRRSNAPKKGDTKADPASIEKANLISATLPITRTAPGVSEIKKSELPEPIEGGAYRKLRLARAFKRSQGARDKREKDKAEAEAKK